eukprot:TRINITY_DN9831_c0_g2_i2.p1 TRINITY_DN9831_c0_g2~~TRINITY_DN9831_c0_g2_i2.p1  ORF type:complete len:615 (+),score=169.96 TRINITY_DN9831_c0_g2_i2:54-1847(+)
MVSSISHVLRGQFDPLTVVLASGFSLWWLTRFHLRPLYLAWLSIGIAPLLLVPDYKFPFEDYVPAAILAPLQQVATSICTPAGIVTLLAGYILARLVLRKNPEPVVYQEDLPDFKILGKKTEPSTIEDIPTVAKELRQSFLSGYSRPLATRIAQLKGLRAFLVENKEAILACLHQDLGRPRVEGAMYDYAIILAEVDCCLANLTHWVQPTSKPGHILSLPASQYMQPDPLGVALIIGTWNFPLQLLLAPLAGALAAGNTALIKPCVISKACAKLLQDELPKYFDPNIVHVLGGYEPRDSPTTHALLEEKWDIIFFTGSPTVGRVIMAGAAKNLTPCVLELGGKNPVYVDRSADIRLAAKRCVWGRNLNAGQQCIAPDFVLCHQDVLDEFAEQCKHFVTELYGQDPKQGNNIGRIVGERQMKRLKGLLQTTKGQFVTGGANEYDEATRYIPPTVVKADMDDVLMEDEIFGPILVITPVKNAAAAVAEINRRPEPLALYVFADDKHVQDLVVQNTRSGGVTVNHCIFHVGNSHLPFGGVGNSGMGAYHGKKSFDVFSHHKPVLVKTWLPDFGLISDAFFIYPPWNGLKEQLLGLAQPLM